jgi:hypothetical protein
MKSSSLFVIAAMLASVPSAAYAQDHCSRETLTVRSTPVTIGYCLSGEGPRAGGGVVALAVNETYNAASGSFARASTMRFVTGEGPSRVLENVALDQLGLHGTLHLTLVYAGGLVRIESAMLTPGAITVK